MIKPSKRLERFMTYAFAEVDGAKINAAKRGFRIIDFGVGDPTESLYKGAITALRAGAELHKNSGYPSYIGMPEYRQAVSRWLSNRFGIDANPNTQITTTAGSKEAVFHLPFSLINPGDVVLMPSIGYPPYKAGTVFAGGIPRFYQLNEENGFLPDINEIKGILERDRKIKIIWINYPNNPTTATANADFFIDLIKLSNKHGVLIASDEAYTEMYIKDRPHSILEYTNDWNNIIVFQSLSKRSNATGIRLGFAVGGEEVISYFRKLRTQIDSGVPNAIQEAGIAALSDEEHVQRMRELYDKKRNILTAALDDAGIKYWANSTFYVWAKTGGNSMEFAKRMLQIDTVNKIGINVTPGAMLAIGDAPNADNYVRLALVPPIKDIELAAELLRSNLRK
jgi:LL-diaminopimelate aminotransferase